MPAVTTWPDVLPSPLALAAGVALMAVGGFAAYFFRRGARLRVATASTVLLAVGGAGLLLVGRRWSLALPPLLLAGACAAVLASHSPRVSRAGAALLALLRGRAFPLWLVAALALPLGLWWGFAVDDQALTFRDADDFVRLSAEDSLEEVAAPRALTDRGRAVRLFRLPEASQRSEVVTAGEAALLANQELMDETIRVAPADPGYNCHGWVFAGGRFWVKGEDVDLLLHDNGYRHVTVPQVDDVVVYRDGEGRVVHSGVVRAVGRDGLVLVESKWGRLCRFIHTPACYPGRHSYYRTARGGHEVRGLGTAADGEPRNP
jgi:hypothetical protein